VTREDYITKEDREVWERFRATWRADGSSADADTGIDGADASLIAAFLDERLRDEERTVFERRLAEEPALLDSLLAAKTGLHSGPTQSYAVPESILVWASNTFTAEVSSRRQPTVSLAPRHRKKRRLLFRPAFAAIGVSLVLVIAAGVGTLLLTHDDPGIVAQADRAAEKKQHSADKWDPRTNSIFSNPENAYFDGLDVD
jgi:hypothetical protein